MNYLKLLLISIVLIGCKKKTFADDIVLSFPKETEMKIQKFNSDSIDFGSNIIYKGFSKDSIQIRYYKDIDWFPPPPPPGEKVELNYIIEKSLLTYFYQNPFQGNSSEDVEKTDGLNSKNLEIIVKENDTIPLYKIRNEKIISFKSYPIFIKNIGSKSLKIDIDYFRYFSPFVKTKSEKWQNIKNTRYIVFGCIPPPRPTYIILKPNEFVILSLPFLNGKEQKEFKIKLDRATSKIYKSSISEEIMNNQRIEFFK